MTPDTRERAEWVEVSWWTVFVGNYRNYLPLTKKLHYAQDVRRQLVKWCRVCFGSNTHDQIRPYLRWQHLNPGEFP